MCHYVYLGNNELNYLGGETPIISSIGLAAAIEKQAPDFFDALFEKGVRYVYRYGSAFSVFATLTGADFLFPEVKTIGARTLELVCSQRMARMCYLTTTNRP